MDVGKVLIYALVCACRTTDSDTFIGRCRGGRIRTCKLEISAHTDFVMHRQLKTMEVLKFSQWTVDASLRIRHENAPSLREVWFRGGVNCEKVHIPQGVGIFNWTAGTRTCDSPYASSSSVETISADASSPSIETTSVDASSASVETTSVNASSASVETTSVDATPVPTLKVPIVSVRIMSTSTSKTTVITSTVEATATAADINITTSSPSTSMPTASTNVLSDDGDTWITIGITFIACCCIFGGVTIAVSVKLRAQILKRRAIMEKIGADIALDDTTGTLDTTAASDIPAVLEGEDEIDLGAIAAAALQPRYNLRPRKDVSYV